MSSALLHCAQLTSDAPQDKSLDLPLARQAAADYVALSDPTTAQEAPSFLEARKQLIATLEGLLALERAQQQEALAHLSRGSAHSYVAPASASGARIGYVGSIGLNTACMGDALEALSGEPTDYLEAWRTVMLGAIAIGGCISSELSWFRSMEGAERLPAALPLFARGEAFEGRGGPRAWQAGEPPFSSGMALAPRIYAAEEAINEVDLLTARWLSLGYAPIFNAWPGAPPLPGLGNEGSQSPLHALLSALPAQAARARAQQAAHADELRQQQLDSAQFFEDYVAPAAAHIAESLSATPVCERGDDHNDVLHRLGLKDHGKSKLHVMFEASARDTGAQPTSACNRRFPRAIEGMVCSIVRAAGSKGFQHTVYTRQAWAWQETESNSLCQLGTRYYPVSIFAPRYLNITN